MVILTCSDYGYECKFVSTGEIKKVVKEYRERMYEEHGIDYNKEAILQFITRKINDW